MITNEMMFYGGIVIAAAALAAGIVCLLTLKIKKTKLDAQLDEEYGEEVCCVINTTTEVTIHDEDTGRRG